MNLRNFKTTVSYPSVSPQIRLTPTFNIPRSQHQKPCSSLEVPLSICSKPAANKSHTLGGSSLHFPLQKRAQFGKTFCSVGICTYPESVNEFPSHTHEEKTWVLLLNLGGPDTLHDVQPFLFNLFADPDIIRLPRLFQFLQRPLAQLISVLRAPKSKEGYAAIGGGSPLRRITDDQANALKMALIEKEVSANVYVAMRYWHPFTEEAVQQIKRDRITRLVVLPLVPYILNIPSRRLDQASVFFRIFLGEIHI
ncbi:unnamed protein product [Cuscuta epithymum]|uniref:protoporphyrin ferrochelatase n=1 Tax=Cuscuta epithymum TaxID=186058 RepID=A0AAV0ETQ7_9ASTE|nr:unnamed protein product [Cuscuta epithymum]CAH9126615.1 unnamed protein product [Cuscuta epithymum]